MSEEPVTGRPIVNPGAFPRVQGATLDARGAAAVALQAFLQGIVFYRRAGKGKPPTAFKLEKVYDTWPDPQQDLVYPSASVLDRDEAELDGHNLVPTMLDDTFERFCPGTVLWKTDELDVDFQVDFWLNDEPTRKAIMATLPGAFSPDEDRAGVLVEGTSEYWDHPVRLTLHSYRRSDTSSAVHDRERRVVCRVSAQLDVLVLRKAVPFVPRIGLAVSVGPASKQRRQP